MSEASSGTPAVGAIEEFEAVKQRSLWIDALERLIRNRAAMIGLFVGIILVLTAAFGPLLAPYDYTRTDISNIAALPSWEHWMGTDLIGRDVFSRIIHGARTAVFVALVVITISTVLGVVLGSVAAYLGRIVDDIIMRLTDTTLSFPDLLLAAFISASVRRPVIDWLTTLQNRTQWGFLDETIFVDYALVFGALALVSWAGYARLIRGQVISLREQDFIRAQEALGIPDRLIIMRHLIPNAIAPVIVSVTLSVGSVMLLEASLSFLGFGIQPPGASWGNMINANLHEWRFHPHLVAMPGLTLAMAVIGFNFLGDGINDALNPRQIRR